MDIRKQVTSLYEQYGAPALTNFRLEDVMGNGPHEAGVFTLADVNGDVVLIRRKPQADHPGLETFWWIPGGAHEAGEKLDEAAVREFQEETGSPHRAATRTVVARNAAKPRKTAQTGGIRL